MKTIADNLSAASSPVNDSELVSHILFGLPEEYESISTSIYSRGLIRRLNKITMEGTIKPNICKNQRCIVRFALNLDTQHWATLSQIRKNLDNNVYLEFHLFHCYVKDPQGKILLKGYINQGLYRLETTASSSPSNISSQSNKQCSSFAMVGEQTSIEVWHSRLLI
ncbi:hypothetical protein LIER_33912 [Lithospermum erythrorhizon]|uniref:Retrovirus-related Pol polyprotein from transposon TNT 1-94 n=1 Tax=Lithospermum erythrorhizon TaxID=34254 RepID=A0AAV3RYW0_LITER